MATFWFIIDVIFWVGFFILEGFDFGVGALHGVVGRTEPERRLAVNTIGPFWDGNEVWLIVAGAVIFAAFPLWYATMFSAFYLALVVVLAALMVRGVSFEFRSKDRDPRWVGTWRWSLTIGSALIPLLVGVALGDLLHGLPINQAHQFTGNFFTLLQPYGLWTGLTLLSLSLLSGATFLTLKTTGPVHDRAMALAPRLGVVASALTIGFVVWTQVQVARGVVPSLVDGVAVLAVLGATWAAQQRAQGWAFLSASLAAAFSVMLIFVSLYPHVMVSTTNAAYSLTVHGTASPPYTLKVMTIVAVIFTPFVLAYQAWNFWVFRKRLSSPPVDTAAAGAGS
ncbi:MAG TPA: cytochrome d ubiquinol oxidase subunit II [Acidimicrobiales bacterium]|nr:cytochrome d ubiquinol oxidase subunit II [Acidimicrobiales bacterium]